MIAHRTGTGAIFTDKIIAKAHNNNHQFKLFNKNVNRRATHCERYNKRMVRREDQEMLMVMITNDYYIY